MTATRTFPCPNCSRMRRMQEKYEREISFCHYCDDAYEVTVDIRAILDAVAPVKDGKASFRHSRPKAKGYDPAPGKHPVFGAAYVWRMIRFHSGADMHMPVMAPDYVGVGWLADASDKPLIEYLDKIADAIGEHLYGKTAMLRASAAWGSALGLQGADEVRRHVEQTAGMPLSSAGYDVGDADASPEAFVEEHLGEDGEFEESPDR
jgi:hypothetical protein